MAKGIKEGSHPEKALSAAFVRTAKEPGKYFDGHGLFLKVDKSGAKRWVQRINIRGKRTEMGLGSASLVSLAEARETALKNRKTARTGGDPLRSKREADAIISFEEAAQGSQNQSANLAQQKTCPTIYLYFSNLHIP